jgi:prevent-host-death family protein
MTRRYSVAEARSHLPGILHDVEGGAQVEITRRGEPVAVLLSAADYRQLARGGPSFRQAYAQWRQTVDLQRIGLSRREIAAVRDRSPGRPVKI